ncbi:hypothetical protein HUT16_29245 [Kitasatospora sp. NA04385]|uniref:hypothetical protein n=1 Tax=Kitasatospora sp. NA04385 TaxID=2742135 RepID=UPI00158FFF62|nr:hypothetical protein [Kitasatospora sp. NA04385]QKW22631.1 hypothetical protein HUT16_29245 [Kitasatospora sp. NA04385]
MDLGEAMNVPELYRGLFDDAAVFPPGDLPLAGAVPAHRAHRAAWYAGAVGPLLAPVDRLAELRALAPGFAVGLVVGPGRLAEALEAADGLELAIVEYAAGEDVRAAVAELDALLPEGVGAAVELPRSERLEDGLDALTGTRYRAKYRTGGLGYAAFPSVTELAAFLRGCAERALPYKCTAGLHHAVRHTDLGTGYEHHGFLNLLLAAAASDRAQAVELLAERDGARLATAVESLTGRQVTDARASFTSFGTCSIAEPLEDLARLGLLETP